MRSILIDWMNEIHFNFKHMDTTLNLSIMYLDYVSAQLVHKIDKSNYQLYGTVCCKIMDIVNENSREYYKQNNSNEQSLLTSRSSTPIQIVNTEKSILSFTNFTPIMKSACHFIYLYSDTLQISQLVQMSAHMQNEIFQE